MNEETNEYLEDLVRRVLDEKEANLKKIEDLRKEVNLWKSRAYFAADTGFFEVGGPGSWVNHSTGEYNEGSPNFYKNQSWYIPVSDGV